MGDVKGFFLSVAVASALPSSAAYSKYQNPSFQQNVTQDVECLIVASEAQGSFPNETAELDEPKTSQSMLLVGYFVGKLEGRAPDADLSNVMTSSFVKNVDENRLSIALTCTNEASHLLWTYGKLNRQLQALKPGR